MLKSIRAALSALLLVITFLPQAARAAPSVPAPTITITTGGSSIGAIAANRRRGGGGGGGIGVPIGANVLELAWFQFDKPAVDYLKQNDAIAYFNSGGVFQGPLPAGNFDANGWPSTTPDGNDYVAWPFIGPTAANQQVDVTWTSGTILNMTISGESFTLISSNLGARTARFQLNTAASATTNGYLLRYQMNEADPPKGLKMVNVGASGLVEPGWAADIETVAAGRPLRLMKWRTKIAPVTWAGRNTLTSGDWLNHNDGVPIEFMVAVWNATGTIPWVTLPFWADDAYITNTAAYVRDNSTAPYAYFEVGNEPWNAGEGQTPQLNTEGVAANYTQAGYTPSDGFGATVGRWADLHKHHMALVDAVYAGQLTKRKRVISPQNDQPTMTNALLDFTQGSSPGVSTANFVDVVASAPYAQLDQAVYPYGGTYTSADIPGVLQNLKTGTGGGIHALTKAAQTQAIATSYGKNYITYEAGPDVEFNSISFQQLLHRDARFYDWYLWYIQNYQLRLGTNSPLVLFAWTGGIGQRAWGLREYQGQTHSKAVAPKWQAVTDHISGVRELFALTYPTLSVAQNVADGTVLGGAPTDGTTAGTVYSLADNDGGRVAINPATGVLSVANHLLFTGTGTRNSTVRQTIGGGTNGPLDTVVSYAVTAAVNNTHAYRYYRLLLVSPNGSQGGNIISEVEIAATPGGTNTAQSATASASESFGGSFVIGNINDGNLGTSWGDSQANHTNVTVTFDYGPTAANWIAANQFKITGSALPPSLKWQGSDNNTTWTDLVVDGAVSGTTKTWVV